MKFSIKDFFIKNFFLNLDTLVVNSFHAIGLSL